MSSTLLSVKNLHTQFAQAGQMIKAVDGVSFEINRGETFALVGESGCGKSVTALSVLRLLPDSAEITGGVVNYAGVDLLREPEHRMQTIRGARIAMIFQDPMVALNPVISIGDQIAESIRTHQNLTAADTKARVIELIEQVGIADAKLCFRQYPHQLSGGMRQRVLIAIALACEPDLLIADEPTTALDVTIQAQILVLLKELQQQNGMALWLITHDLGIVSNLADKVAVMYAGELVELASRDDFFRKPLHPYSQALFKALPSFDKRSSLLSSLSGAVPSLSEGFQGCRFANRCEAVQASCMESKVEWVAIKQGSGQHSIRCRRVKELQAPSLSNKVSEDRVELELDNKKTILELKNLKVHFPVKKGFLKRTVGYVKAVDDISLQIEAGKTVALVGESGCGKSTLAKAILQLIATNSGQVLYDGNNLSKLSDRSLKSYRQKIQIIFQDPFSSMNPRMLVGDILKEGMKALLTKLSNEEQHLRCLALLKQVGLAEDVLLRYPHEFSGGQRQRICIARALAVNPAVLICDEPTSALDVSVQAQVLNLLKKLQQEKGLAYLFISHDLSVVSYLADTVQVMYAGKIVESGMVEEVMQNPAHPYTQTLIEAIPFLGKGNNKPNEQLSTNSVTAGKPIKGCQFQTRCDWVMEKCRQQQPEDMALNNQHVVACFKY